MRPEPKKKTMSTKNWNPYAGRPGELPDEDLHEIERMLDEIDAAEAQRYRAALRRKLMHEALVAAGAAATMGVAAWLMAAYGGPALVYASLLPGLYGVLALAWACVCVVAAGREVTR